MLAEGVLRDPSCPVVTPLSTAADSYEAASQPPVQAPVFGTDEGQTGSEMPLRKALGDDLYVYKHTTQGQWSRDRIDATGSLRVRKERH
jgi:hypothetical protein